MKRLPVRVVKVGGSLFDVPELGHKVCAWLDAEPKAHNVLIAGGGQLVGQIRRLGHHNPVEQELAHWFASI